MAKKLHSKRKISEPVKKSVNLENLYMDIFL